MMRHPAGRVATVLFFLAWAGAQAAVAVLPAAQEVLAAGQSFSRIAPGKTGIRYHVMVPSGYVATTPATPLLITFSPGGNGQAIADNFEEGADRAGWLLVGCDSLRNGMTDHALELRMEDEVLDAVLKTLPHDPQRVYLGGFSGGAMRAYGLTARRPEPFAGVLACGGWLGGPDYQQEPYREGLSVSMINGIQDRAANGWMPIDTKTLQARGATVKHFAFHGGHGGAPPSLIAMAIDWHEQQWRIKTGFPRPDRISLEILYVGFPGKRADNFIDFLSGYFQSVRAVSPEQLTLDLVNSADVLLLDAPVRSFPEGLAKATVLVGASAGPTAVRYGSKIEVLRLSRGADAVFADPSHPLFQAPLAVSAPLNGMTLSIDTMQKTDGMLARRESLAGAEDCEILASERADDGAPGVSMVREAHRLFWGFPASPGGMTPSGRRLFVNALVWIHQFDGVPQSVLPRKRTRLEMMDFLNGSSFCEDGFDDWFSPELLSQMNGDAGVLCNYIENRLPYVYVPDGSGLFRVDPLAEEWKTPNNELASLSNWIDRLSGEQGKQALSLLQRYTGKRFRKNPKQWTAWLNENKASLHFRDDLGYRFCVELTRSSNAGK